MKKPFFSPLILITISFFALILAILWIGGHGRPLRLSLPDDMLTLSGQDDFSAPSVGSSSSAPPVSTQELLSPSVGQPSLPSSVSDSSAFTEDPFYVAFPLNINVATKENLMLLPGIGQVLAQRIVDYRSTNGLFSSVDELTQVPGISHSLLQKIKDDITVGD